MKFLPPSELPPSPDLVLSKSDGYRDEATIEFATQLRATPPPYTQFLVSLTLTLLYKIHL